MDGDEFAKPISTRSLKRRPVHDITNPAGGKGTPKSSPYLARRLYRDPAGALTSDSDSEVDAGRLLDRSLAEEYTDDDTVQEVQYDAATLTVKESTKVPSPNKLYPDLSIEKERIVTTVTRKFTSVIPETVLHPSQGKRWMKPLLYLSILLAGLAIGTAFYKGMKQEPIPGGSLTPAEKPPYEEMQQKLLTELQKLKRKFPGQTKESWITWLAAINGTLRDSPEQPATLLLVSSDGSIQTCLAKNLAAIVNVVYGDTEEAPLIDVTALIKEHQDVDEIKELLDKELRSALEQSHAVIVKDVHQLPPRAAMLLHGYCDNFAAPYKQSVIILTMSTKAGDPPDMERYLHRLWSPTLGVDTSSSLVSRILNHVVYVSKEKEVDGCIPINPF